MTDAYLSVTAGVHRFSCKDASGADATALPSFDPAHEVKLLLMFEILVNLLKLPLFMTLFD